VIAYGPVETLAGTAARTAAVSAVLGAAAGAVLLTASPAAATQGSEVFVSPEHARPGHPVRVTATGCITDNPDAIARASSDAFPTITPEPYPGGEAGNVSGTATVFDDAPPGPYTVTVSCDITTQPTATTTLTVID
jgi:hypothetical protein